MKPHNTLIILLLLTGLFSTSAQAFPWKLPKLKSNNNQGQVSQSANSFMTTFRPPNKSQPKYTVGGAVRGDTCAIDNENQNEITALVPETEQSLTLQTHPTFFAYVSPMNGAKSATLIVKDDTEDYYYAQNLTIPAAGGILKLSLAQDAPPLEIGTSYTWFLRIQCNAYLEPQDPQISATITRIEGNIPSVNQEDLMLFYADSEVWYDSLNTAFELSQSGKDFYWSELLSNIGMNRFVDNDKINVAI